MTAPLLDWQPIATAPKDGTEVLLARIGETEFRLGFACDGEWVVAEEKVIIAADNPLQPTHWLPIPPVPAPEPG